MNATAEAIDALLAELAARSVRIEPKGDGDLTYRAPKGALTPDLRNRLVEFKRDVLARVKGPRAESSDEVESIDPDELTPCPTCGSLDAWLPCAGDRFGRTPGRWRCSICDPPKASGRMREAAERRRADEARRRAAGTARAAPDRRGGP